MNGLGKVLAYINDFKAHWNVPYKGRIVPNKEIAAYGFGGMGVYFATLLVNAIGLSANNILVGASIGIKPVDLQIMAIVANILGFGITICRSYIFDNTKSKEGKFRPWILRMALPTCLSGILFVWLPYEHMAYQTKAVSVFLCFMLISIFNPFFTEAYGMIAQVLSPDSEERTDIISVSNIIYSFAPTVANLFIPIFAVSTGGLNNIRTYRMIYPVITLVGVAWSYYLYKGTRERIIKSKGNQAGIRFVDALRSISKNKYFWITNSATWVGFLEGASAVILSWTFVYAMPLERQALYGVAQTVIGNGALWAMMLAPFLIRLIGKRNLLIWCNVANVILLAFMYPFYQNIWIIIGVCYLNNFVSVFSNIYIPGMNADMKDYQQYITGERIDGMFGVMGMIGTVIGFGTGLVVPAIYQSLGLKDDYNVLYNADIRNNLFEVLIIASVVGAILNVIPYLFYDLTEIKHKGIVRILKIRAMFEDYGDNRLDDKELIETMSYINSAYEHRHMEVIKIDTSELKQARRALKENAEFKEARKNKDKEAIERMKKPLYDAKAKISETKGQNAQIQLSPVVLVELCKFETKRYHKQLEISKSTIAKGMSVIDDYDSSAMKEAREMPKKTKEEKQIRDDCMSFARKCRTAQRLKLKYYPDSYTEPDPMRLINAQNLESHSIIQVIANKMKVSQALKECSIYYRTIKPFKDSENTILSEKNYSCLDEIREKYAVALENVQQEEENQSQVVEP